MQTRGASEICKREMQIIDAKVRCTWQIPMRRAKVMGAANERFWSIFLFFMIWSSKPSKLWPELGLDMNTIKITTKVVPREPWERHRAPQETKMVTKGVPRGPQKRKSCSQGPPERAQGAPKSFKNRPQNALWRLRKNKKWKCNKPMRKSLVTSPTCNKHIRRLHVRKRHFKEIFWKASKTLFFHYFERILGTLLPVNLG